MQGYFIITWIVTFFSIIKKNKLNLFVNKLFLCLTILIFGFAYQYNVDWLNYEAAYLGKLKLDDVLYEVLMKIGNSLEINYWYFQFIIVSFSILIYFKMLNKLDRKNFFLIFLANFPSFYTLNSGTIRQNLAIIFCYLFLLIEKSYLKYIFLIASIFIHKTSIIFIFVYMLFFITKRIKLNKNIMKFILIIIIISFIFLILPKIKIYRIFYPVFNIIPNEFIRDKLLYNLSKILTFPKRFNNRVFLKNIEMLAFISIFYYKKVKIQRENRFYFVATFSYIFINSFFNLEVTFLRIGLYFEIFYYYFFINSMLKIKPKLIIKIILYCYFLFISVFSYPTGVKYQYFNYIIHKEFLGIMNPRENWVRQWWRARKDPEKQQQLLEMEIKK